MNETPFSYVDPSTPFLRRILIRSLEKLTGAQAVEKLYLENRARMQPGENWFRACLETLRVDVQVDQSQLAKVPRSGALIFVSNHPFGVLDGIAMSWITSLVRDDFLVLTNAVLLRAPEIAPYVLPVDFDPTPDAVKTNVESRAKARAHVMNGGCLVIFPAGAVSTSPDFFGRKPAVDSRWQPIAASLAEKSGATIVPVHFVGQNSRLFQVMSHIHPMLRLALFFHELRRHIGKSVEVQIGDPVRYQDLPKFDTRQALSDHLMKMSYGLDQPRPR
jgi:putative hemolysin